VGSQIGYYVQKQNLAKAPNGQEFLEHLSVQFCGCKSTISRGLDGNIFHRSSFSFSHHFLFYQSPAKRTGVLEQGTVRRCLACESA
jgi:hypothetical protein